MVTWSLLPFAVSRNCESYGKKKNEKKNINKAKQETQRGKASYRRLNENERKLLCVLGVFENPQISI